jgi:hypothetical protein
MQGEEADHSHLHDRLLDAEPKKMCVLLWELSDLDRHTNEIMLIRAKMQALLM